MSEPNNDFVPSLTTGRIEISFICTWLIVLLYKERFLMLALFRLLHRSGGVFAALLALLGFAFYGIAVLSVALVENPSQAIQILAVFLALSVVFCALAIWVFRRLMAQMRRPLDSAVDATSRIASIGGKGGRDAIRFLGKKSAAAGEFMIFSMMAAGRTIVRVAYIFDRKKNRKIKDPSVDSDQTPNVIPMRRYGGSRDDGMRR